jgi:CHAD domain-containing protein
VDDAERAFAAVAVLERLEMLTREAAGVKEGGDVESVHRMRVASRRLRTALRVFGECLPAQPLKVWNREVKRVTRALGEARDLDVQIAFLADHDSPRRPLRLRPGIRRLRLRMEQRRADLQQRVIRRVQELETSRVAESMLDRLSPLAVAVPASTALMRRVQREVQNHLDELLEFRPYVDRPKCVAELHRMRIATKHLRYTLELLRPLHSEAFKEPLEAAKLIQQLLGDLHDCDVWVGLLPEFAAAERTRAIEYGGSDHSFRPLVPGIAYFQRRVLALRRKHYREFARAWHESERRSVWEGLREAVARPAAPERE